MNPASRIHQVLTSSCQQSPQNQVLEGWANVFELPQGQRSEDDVTLYIVALRGELDLVEEYLKERGAPDDLYAPFRVIRTATSTTRLHSYVRDSAAEISRPDVVLSVQWAAWAMRDEDETDGTSVVADLARELDNLEQALQSASLSPQAQSFISRQLHILRRALKLYKVRGGTSIREAYSAVAGDLIVNGGAMAKEARSGTPQQQHFIQRFAAAVEKTGKVCDAVSKMKKGAEDVIAFVESASTLVRGFLPPP